MSQAEQWIQRARQSRDAAEADACARQAVLSAPDRPEGYLIRGQLAVHRKDAVAAAHHLRIAFARGARDPFTRDVLACCLEAAGQGEFAAKMRLGTTDRALIEALTSLAAQRADGIRAALSRPLPPPGSPGLLPGEPAALAGPPSGPPAPRPAGPPAGAPPPGPAPADPPPLGAVRIPRPTGNITLGPPTLEEPRPPRLSGSLFREARPSDAHLEASAPIGPPPQAAPIINRRGAERPSWLESTPEYAGAGESAPEAGWLEDPLAVAAAETPASAVRFEAGGVEITVDPGPPTVGLTSPVTGATIPARPRAVDEGVMPDLGAPSDPLEARVAFLGLLDPAELEYAVRLPGPVLTREGAAPRRLAETVGLALAGQTILLRDLDRPQAPPQRLPLAGFHRVDVLAEGQQLSCFFPDGRGLHFDLRELRGRALLVAVALVDTLVDRLGRLGSG